MKWSYLAGFVDGEGCFAVSNHGRQISLSIAQKEDQSLVIDLIAEKLKSNGISFHLGFGTNNTGCDFKRIVISGQSDLKTLVLKLLPFLIVKRVDAEAALEFLAAKEEARLKREATCKYGHPRTKENTYVAPRTGKKSCLACRTYRSRTRDGSAPDISIPGYAAPVG